MVNPHVGQVAKLWPQGTHTLKCPQGTNASARGFVEHTIHRLVAIFVDACCDEELEDDWDNDWLDSLSHCLSSGKPQGDGLLLSNESILMHL
jgi:hypothetical protein